jgi:hypothetical protein
VKKYAVPFSFPLFLSRALRCCGPGAASFVAEDIGQAMVEQIDKPIARAPGGVAQAAGNGRGMHALAEDDAGEGLEAATVGGEQQRQDQGRQGDAERPREVADDGGKEALDGLGNAE